MMHLLEYMEPTSLAWVFGLSTVLAIAMVRTRHFLFILGNVPLFQAIRPPFPCIFAHSYP